MWKSKTWLEHKEECEQVTKDGITILDFVEPWQGVYTKLLCKCTKHGLWDSTSITQLKSGRSCPACGKESTVKAKEKSWDKYLPELTSVAKTNNYKILGFIEPWSGNKTKLRCYCKKHGVWETTTISRFKSGAICPRCYNRNSRSWESYLAELTPIANEKSYKILGTVGDWTGTTTKLRLLCEKHGEWSTTSISNFRLKSGCPGCGKENLKISRKIPDEDTAEKLTLISKFKDGTKFWKSNNRTTDWEYYCPACSEDEYVKAGVCSGIFIGNVENRLSEQNRRNLFQMQTLMIYTFESVTICKNAEFACKQELEKSWLTKRELKDGWTETTAIQNLDKIIEIYERFGGIRL